MVSEHIEKAMRKIEGWWEGELIGERTCIGFVVPKPFGAHYLNRKNWRLIHWLISGHFKDLVGPLFASRKSTNNIRNVMTRKDLRSISPLVSLIYQYFNELWPHPEEDLVDIERFVKEWAGLMGSVNYFGEEIPRLLHQFGARGFPITMAAYLGADLTFEEDTILKKPVIDIWDKFEFEIQPPNIWYEHSLKLVELATRESKGEFLVDIPDLGDVLTNFYQLRGHILFEELGLNPKILEARDRFIKLWINAYESFWKITSQKFPGSSHWLIWAPGKSYACQCDASCIALSTCKEEVAPIILSEIVKNFIVPEIERLGKYLDYIIWHLDGEEELQFLDVLLEMPQIKAIQWRPICGNPADEQWIPIFKKIQKAKKSLWLAVQNEEEVKRLIENLAPERLYLSGGFTGRTEEEAREFLKWVEGLTRERMKNMHF